MQKWKLALDPGTTKTGYVMSRDVPDFQIGEFGKIPNGEIMSKILSMSGQLEEVVCEFPKARGQLASNDLFVAILWIGRFSQQLATLGIKCFMIDRKDVKMHLCRSSKATDANIRQALIDRFGGDEVAIGDKKCRTCDGKGKVGPRQAKVVCPDCNGAKRTPPGPLAGFTNTDSRSALAIALTFSETRSTYGPTQEIL